MKPALLLIDLQRDFLHDAAMAPVVRVAGQLLTRCRQHGIPVAHVWTTVSREADRRMAHWRHADRWICEAGMSGHSPPAPLRPIATETILHKTVFSPFVEHDVTDLLRRWGCDTVWLAGVHLHACVRATALDAYQRGFGVVIVEDATGSDDPLHGAMTRLYLSRRGIRFASLDSLASLVSPSQPALTLTVPQRSPWSWSERVAELQQFRERLQSAADELTELIVTEVHKPIRYARAEVQRSIALIDATLRHAATPLDTARVRYRPLGRVGVITPWNNPVAIPVGKIAPAILYGNTVVWKPSPLAERVSRYLSQLLPRHQLVTGGAEAAIAVMEAVDAVTLTGSNRAGFTAQTICGRRRIPLQAELGGNNAAIVWDDADLRDAARQIAEGAFGFAGQRCTANRRVIVLERVLEAFLRELRPAVEALVCGDPRDEQTQVGPMITSAAAARVAATVADAETVFTTSAGTVVWGRDPNSEIVQEETFGPVLVVQPARNWEEALALCNGTRYGLVAALFSRDPARQAEFLERAEAGILKLNRATADADAESPFGGWKHSGIGPPEHGASDREFYTRTQAVYRE